MATELKRAETTLERIEELLGDSARTLLDHKSQTVSKDLINLPGPDFVDRVSSATDRSPSVLRSLQTLFDNGRLAGTGYLSILPVDQGIEHSAGASFAPNPAYFDPANIVKLAVEGGCNAVATTFGVLGAVSRTYAPREVNETSIGRPGALNLLAFASRFSRTWSSRRRSANTSGSFVRGITPSWTK